MATPDRMLVEVFPPGEFLREELDARGWLQADFAAIIGKDAKSVSDIISGKRIITPEMAMLIGEALGTGAAIWLNLENDFQLRKAAANRSPEDDVARKAKLYEKYPIREMVKRGWISKDHDALEAEISSFFSRLDFPYAARMKEDDSKLPLQSAWLHRTYNIAKTMHVETFTELKLARAMKELNAFLISRDCVDEVPEILRECGIRFIVNKWLPSSKIDGVCLWLDDRSPVVALSLRYDRIDSFWFTLMHELHHVKYGHAKEAALLDVGLDERNESISEEERQADDGAVEFLVPQEELKKFIARVRPAFTPLQIKGFSKRMRVHPGIVVGQLKHRGHVAHNHHTRLQVPIRELITSTSTYDGWGMVA